MQGKSYRSSIRAAGGLLAVLAVGCQPIPSAGGGGGGGTNQPIPVAITLSDTAGDFAVTADEPTEKIIQINFDNLSLPTGTEVAGGTFLLEPENITFQAAGPGKFGVAAQATDFTVEVTGFAFAQDSDGGCGDGDEYGVYEVAIEGLAAVSVTPTSITLQPATLVLINDNNLSICLRVTSPVDGIVRIAGLDFTIMAGTTEIGS